MSKDGELRTFVNDAMGRLVDIEDFIELSSSNLSNEMKENNDVFQMITKRMLNWKIANGN